MIILFRSALTEYSGPNSPLNFGKLFTFYFDIINLLNRKYYKFKISMYYFVFESINLKYQYIFNRKDRS